MKKLMQRFKNERGLTLVELLAVIVILAIIAIIAFVFIGGIIENSKKDAHVANAQQIISAAKLYDATGGELSVTVEKLQEDDHLDEMFDPWTKDPYDDDMLDSVTVSKDSDKGYVINGFNASSDKCNLNDKSETDLAKDGRDACNN